MSEKQVPELTISDECKYCGEGEPEWSSYAKCWIHRRPWLDKRCTRKVIGPVGEPIASPQATSIDQMGQEAMADGIYEKVPASPQATRPHVQKIEVSTMCDIGECSCAPLEPRQLQRWMPEWDKSNRCVIMAPCKDGKWVKYEEAAQPAAGTTPCGNEIWHRRVSYRCVLPSKHEGHCRLPTPSEGTTPQAERPSIIEQLCRDLNSAHDEILRAQSCSPEDFCKYDWPEWSPQANSIRWAETLLKKRLAKTTAWTYYPETGDPAPTVQEARAVVPVETPEVELCQICHRENPVWFAPNAVWNAVVTEISGILCPICFIKRAEQQGFRCTGWELVPELVNRPTDDKTPVGVGAPANLAPVETPDVPERLWCSYPDCSCEREHEGVCQYKRAVATFQEKYDRADKSPIILSWDDAYLILRMLKGGK